MARPVVGHEAEVWKKREERSQDNKDERREDELGGRSVAGRGEETAGLLGERRGGHVDQYRRG